MALAVITRFFSSTATIWTLDSRKMNSAILVAAGKGTRMGADKLFLELAGRPVIAHSWQRFDDAKCIDEIVVVVAAAREKEFDAIAKKYRFKKPFRIVIGGAERQDS